MGSYLDAAAQRVGNRKGQLDMDAFPIEQELILAVAVAAAFVLGLITHRFATSLRRKRVSNALTDQVSRLEEQRDAAHRVSLELAASHTKLIGEQQESEWMIRNLKSDLRLRDARIEKLSDDFGTELPSINDDMWITEDDLVVGTN